MSLFRVTTIRYILDGRRVPKGTPGARKVKAKSRKWYGRVPGNPRAVPLSTNKTAAGQMLAALIKKAELGKAGILDPFEEHRRRPLLDHVADFESYLTAKGSTAKHAREAGARVRRVVEGCRLTFIGDLTLSPVQEFLAALRDGGPALPPLDPAKDWYRKAELAKALGVKPHSIPPLVARWSLAARGKGKARRYPRETAEALRQRLERTPGPATVNHYVRSLRSFTHWLVRDRRIGDDPLAGLSSLNATTDVRHARRPLSPEELGRVLQAALDSPKEYRGLSGRDRHFLYLTACASGFRASELSALLPGSFALDATPPTATVPAAYTKNKRVAVQPLSAEVVEALRGYLEDRPAGCPVWPGSWPERAAQMFQFDLETAGIPYVVEGPDGPLYADFHALRHSYIALLDRAGLTLKMAMQLARHSDPKLTMARYGRAQLHDLGSAVEGLAGLLPTGPDGEAPTLAATGTDGREDFPTPLVDLGCTKVVQPNASPCRPVITLESRDGRNSPIESRRKSLDRQGVEGGCERLRGDDEGVGDRTRTGDILIHSQVL